MTEIASQSDVKLVSPPPPYNTGGSSYPPGTTGQTPYPAVQQPYPQPQQQYVPAQAYNPNQPTQVVIQPTTTRTVVVKQQGDCPICKGGPVVPQFTCCGIVMGIVFFPIGLICCLAMRRPGCANCGARL